MNKWANRHRRYTGEMNLMDRALVLMPRLHNLVYRAGYGHISPYLPKGWDEDPRRGLLIAPDGRVYRYPPVQ